MNAEDDSKTNNLISFKNKGVLIRGFVRYEFFYLVAMLLYLCWEVFWYMKVGLAFIKWHTHLLLPFYIWILGVSLLKISLSKTSKAYYINLLTIFSAVMFALFLSEFSLLFLNINKTKVELAGNGYVSWYDSSRETWYHTYPLESEHWLISTDFKYARTTNALGFSDRNWHLENKPNEKRILSLGDSFTEGDGAPQDSAYPVLLEKIIKNTNSSFSVMNAGICGSDPFINFVNYRDHLAKYKPNYIIQTLASGDIVVDVFVRGGMERFKENNKISYTKAPWWEPLYATSYVSRLFFSALGYNQLLLKQNAVKLNKARLDQQMVALFKEYASLASSNECQFILILQPYKGEVQNGEYDYDFTSIKEGLKDVPNITILDLIPFYRQFAAKEKKTMDVFYWAQDGHHNASGYEMMAKGVYQCLDSIINPQLNQNPKLN